MKTVLLAIALLICFTHCSCSVKKLKGSDYYGIWVTDSLYNEIISSKSPYLSRHHIYNSIKLELNETSIIQGYDEALDNYKIWNESISSFDLKREDSLYGCALTIINDSTMELKKDPFSEKKVILRKLPNQTNEFQENINENIFLHCIKFKYFKGEKILIFHEELDRHANIDFPSGFKVNGFFPFSEYRLILGGEEDTPPMDIIEFEQMNGTKNYFKFLISDDSIKIYQLIDKINPINDKICDSLRSDLVSGILVYTIFKK